MENTDLPKAKLSSAEKAKILELYDKPYSAVQISRELALPLAVVRKTLRQTCPADNVLWLEL